MNTKIEIEVNENVLDALLVADLNTQLSGLIKDGAYDKKLIKAFKRVLNYYERVV